jgi:hypothetical protein
MMAKKSSWQEDGIRLDSKLFSGWELEEILTEMKKRVRDLEVIN